MTIVVVGAGIVGACVAYHAARAGSPVVLLDRASAPAAGVTGRSFAWIGGPGGRDTPDGSTPLRRSVLEDYRRLEREVPGVRVRWCGSLAWGGQRPDSTEMGQDERLLDAAEARRVEPGLKEPPPWAVWRTTDGCVDPVGVTAALVQAAGRWGAQVRLGDRVTRLRLDDTGVVGVDTAQGAVKATAVVLAAGTGVPALCAPLGVEIPVATSPAALVRVDAPAGLVRGVLAAPDVEVRQAPDGGLLATLDPAGQTRQAQLRPMAAAALRRLQGLLEGGEDAALVDVRVGRRPMPAGGLPIVGPVPGVGGLYVAVMHSAVTLAPVIGRLVAQELVGGLPAPELEGVRGDRLDQPAHCRRDTTCVVGHRFGKGT